MFKRIMSALIMAFLLAAVIFFAPPFVMDTLVVLLVAGGLFEFYRMGLPPERIYHVTGILWGIAVSVALLAYRHPTPLVIALLGGLFVTALVHMRHATALEGVTSRIGVTGLGVVYLGATLPFWALLYRLPFGKVLVLMGIAAAAMCDTFALFFGKVIGRHKFAAMTSPNKTWEGFFGGFLGSVLTVWLVRWFALPEMPMSHVLAVGVCIGFIGPMGDLIESLFKRDYHVKDSGALIPGHGGVLDRVDAMVFVGPFMYLYARWILLV